MSAMLLSALLAIVAIVIACPDHNIHTDGTILQKRAEGGKWTYEASYDWHKLNESFILCQTGTQQSPIPLLFNQGLAFNHRPIFNFPNVTYGTFYNWGYGPAYTMTSPPESNLKSKVIKPTVTFEDDGKNETVTFKGWHIHAPADHTVQNDRSKAELHYVYADDNGNERAVFAIRIDPGRTRSPFLKSLPPMISWRDTGKEVVNTKLDLGAALNEANNFSEYWTYRGSLTSPPCREGLRWFVARNILFVSHEKMQEILSVSTFSARQEQEVWLHAINV